MNSPSLARLPKLVKVNNVSAGVILTLVLHRDNAALELDRLRPYLETHFGAREVRLAIDPSDAYLVRLTIVRNVLLHVDHPCSYGVSREVSVWKPLPPGVDENGEEMRILLIERNLLCGGEPGSGKSGMLNTLLASLALDSTVELYLFDPKEVELGPFAPLARCFAGTNLDAANDQLRMLIDVMNQRFEAMHQLRVRKFEPRHGYGVIVVVIDELPFYDTKGAKEFSNSLRDLLSRGRAASIVVILAAQKPAANTVPSFIRDLIALRAALRCSTREACDTILGGGLAAQGYMSTSISTSQRGVCLFLGEERVPKLMRAY